MSIVDQTERSRTRGQAGIETLVIFIAMILVAATAAGVLVETSGFLQNRAAATSEESGAQVSDRVLVVSAVGENLGPDDDINFVHLTVMKAPGADSVDLTAATVQYRSENDSTLVYGGTNTVPSGASTFTIESLTDDSSPGVLDSGEERTRVTINATAIDAAPSVDDAWGSNTYGLLAGETATIELVAPSGATTTYVATAPPTISDRTAVHL